MSSAFVQDYTQVSEKPGNRVTAEAVQMLYTRYAYAASLAVGKDVLEVACGPGHGLGLLARSARRVVGGDFTWDFVRSARQHYGDDVPVLRLDAQALPFRDAAFDLVLLYEAIYYLPDAPAFLCESRRILRPGGTLLICSANCEWSGFNRSPYSTTYYTAAELRDLLAARGFRCQMFGAFPIAAPSLAGRLAAVVRYAAVRLHLVPHTMAGKQWLKRLFYGKLHQLTPEIVEGMASQARLEPIPPGCSSGFKVIFAAAQCIDDTGSPVTLDQSAVRELTARK